VITWCSGFVHVTQVTFAHAQFLFYFLACVGIVSCQVASSLSTAAWRSGITKNIGYQLPVAGWKSKQQIAMILKSQRHTHRPNPLYRLIHTHTIWAPTHITEKTSIKHPKISKIIEFPLKKIHTATIEQRCPENHYCSAPFSLLFPPLFYIFWNFQ